jgi:hypothetical protein
MNLEFITPLDQEPGTILSLLNRSYADLIASDPSLGEPEQASWKQYDHEVYQQPKTVGLSKW